MKNWICFSLPFEQRRTRQSGQIGIIIILVMVVLLTIGLSLAAQSTRDTVISTQEQDTTQVFNAAEAGVEQALSTNLSSQNAQLTGSLTPAGDNSTVNYTITKVQTLDTRLFQGVSAHIQLTDQNNNQTVTSVNIDWAKEPNCSASPAPASLVLGIFSVDRTVNPPTVSVRYQSIAACNHNDGIQLGNAPLTSGYLKSTTIALQPKDAFIRVKPMYNDTSIHVTGSGGTGQLPVQYYSILSTAQSQHGTETRSVQVNRTLAVEPSIMDYVLFSGNTLLQ